MEEPEAIEYTPQSPDGEPVFTPEPPKSEMRRVFNRIGLGLCLGMLANQLLPGVLAAIPGLNVEAHTFLTGSLCTGLFTLPVMLLFTHSLPRLSAGGFLALLCISYAAMLAGNLVGIGVNMLLSPRSVNLISDLISTEQTPVAEKFLGMVILAPVFEELVFRKVLVDRALPYGEKPAILFSGLVFGLFHGNLIQFFYATLLGMILAYVYIRTGNILYTMGIHASINLLSVLVSLFPSVSLISTLLVIAGVVLFFVLRKRIHVEKYATPGVAGAMFGNAGMILFLFLGICMLVLVAVILNHPELTRGLK